jgi:hypothetical protein
MKLKSRTHGYLDYLVGVLLIAAPWLFGFYRGSAESWVPIAMGAMAIVYSLFTDYELGAIRSIPFKTHLTLDVLSGVFLAASPWIFNFADYVYLPHLIVGLMEIVVASITTKHTEIESRTGGRHYNTGTNPTLSH